MTRKEITEIFSMMMLAWPNAEMFKGGAEKLKPTVMLWSMSFPDLEFSIAQLAVTLLCRENKFPPTIAEFQEKVDKVADIIHEQETEEIIRIRSGDVLYGSLDEYYRQLPSDSFVREVIHTMGGPTALYRSAGSDNIWNFEAFRETYEKLIKSNLHGPHAQRLLKGGRNEKKNAPNQSALPQKAPGPKDT